MLKIRKTFIMREKKKTEDGDSSLLWKHFVFREVG